jgi:hypothetical protein
MNTAAKLSAYGAALALLLGAGYAAGTAVGPFATTPAAGGAVQGGTSSAGSAGHGDTHSGTVADSAANDQPGGLASSRGGYTLTPTDPTLTPGTTEDFTFQIIGPDGAPVTAFDVEHDKRMHLILVRRDTTGYQHLHPEMDAAGTWTVPLAVPAAGSYRAFADFAPAGGEPTTLGVDVAAPGDFAPATHSESRTAQVDGYTVGLTGDLVAGRASAVTLTVARDGVPVTDLQPYLGAYGHLVALREGDLEYLHVHPVEDEHVAPAPGPHVGFAATAPSAGTYRLFLDFWHGDAVHTAAFTVQATGTAADAPAGHGHGG